MIKTEVDIKNLLGHEVRVVDGEYFVLLDIMKILERTTEQGSWSEAKKKILRHMSFDKTFKLIQKNIPIVRTDNRLCYSDTFVIHESRMKEILFILKPSIQSKNYKYRLNIWKQLYELF